MSDVHNAVRQAACEAERERYELNRNKNAGYGNMNRILSKGKSSSKEYELHVAE